jgi:hypothetical protein
MWFGSCSELDFIHASRLAEGLRPTVQEGARDFHPGGVGRALARACPWRGVSRPRSARAPCPVASQRHRRPNHARLCPGAPGRAGPRHAWDAPVPGGFRPSTQRRGRGASRRETTPLGPTCARPPAAPAPPSAGMCLSAEAGPCGTASWEGPGHTGRHPAASASYRRGGEAGGAGAPTGGARPHGGRSLRLGRAQAASVIRPGTSVAPRPSTAGAAGLGPEGHARTAPAWSSTARPTRACPRASGPSASDATRAPHEPSTGNGAQRAPAHGTGLWHGASHPGVAPASGPAP